MIRFAVRAAAAVAVLTSMLTVMPGETYATPLVRADVAIGSDVAPSVAGGGGGVACAGDQSSAGSSCYYECSMLAAHIFTELVSSGMDPYIAYVIYNRVIYLCMDACLD